MIPNDDALSQSNYEMTNACLCSVNTTKCKTLQMVKILDSPSRTIIESPFKEIYQKEELRGVGCGRLDNPKFSYTMLLEILRDFTREFNMQYDIINLQLLENNYMFTFVDTIQIDAKIYRMELHRKTQKSNSKTNRIFLYFMVAKLKTHNVEKMHSYYDNITRICGKEYHIFPILMTPEKATINELGIYNYYIPCGLYICKLFDYSIPNAMQCTQAEIRFGKCSNQYTYIGNRYDNMFPLKEALDTIIFNTECEIDYGTPREEESIDSIEFRTPDSGPRSSSKSSYETIETTVPSFVKRKRRRTKRRKKKGRTIRKIRY